MPPSPAFTPPSSLEGFQIGRRLRESGPLFVHAGTNRLDLPVEAFFARIEGLAGGFEVDDFLAGVRRAASVHHEALLPFVTGGRHDEGFVFAIAKSAEGPTLEEVVAKDGPLSEKRALAMAEAVAGVLSALEKSGMRHGDLGPARLVFAAEGTVVVAPPRLFPASVVPRDEKWQAPEEARGGENGVQSDLFVLGLLLVYALTGAHPLGGSTEVRRALRDWKAPDPAILLQKAPHDVRVLAAKLLAPEPMNRFPSAADALRAIHEASTPPETAPIAIAAPIPTLAPIKAVEPGKRASGRLFVESRLGEATLELDDDVVHVGPGPNKTIRTQAESFPEAVLRIERTPAADVAHAAGGATLKVNELAVSGPHSLSDGEKIAAGEVIARYERAATPRPAARQREAPPPKNPTATMVTTFAVLGTAAALSWGVIRSLDSGKPSAEAKSLAAKSAQTLEDDQRLLGAAPSQEPAKPGAATAAPSQKERDAHDAYVAAEKNARRRPKEARVGWYETWQRFPDTAYGLLARLRAAEIDRAAKLPTDKGLDEILAASENETGVADEEMLNRMRAYAEDHAGTLSGERAHVALVKAQALLNGRFDADMAAIRAAMAKKDWREALDLIRRVQEYATRKQAQELWTEKDKISAAMSETQKESGGGGASAPPPGGDGGKDKPPAPSGGDERIKKADESFKSARSLMEAGKEADAIDAFVVFLRDFKNTPAFAKYEVEARRRLADLAAKPVGVGKLFHGKCDKLDNKGRWRITYDFQDAQQFDDFRDVNAFEAPPRAAWKVDGGAVKCAKGSGALVLDAVFSAAEVSASAVVNPDKPHDIGLMFMDPTESKRFYLFTLQNTFFTLGNADPKPFLENAIVLFGPGMWRDTLPGKIGFVRKCGSTDPVVHPSEPTHVQAGKSGDEVWMKFEDGRSIKGSAFGDMKYEFPGIMPGFFVLSSGGLFHDFVVEGTPDPEWVKKRWEAILSKL